MTAAPATQGVHVRYSVSYASFSSRIDLTLPGRGVSAVFGPSGSGKSTLLRILAGLDRGQNAFVSVNGRLWQDDAKAYFAPVHRRSVGFVFQDACLFPHLSVRQNLDYGRARNRDKRPAADFGDLTALLGIAPLLDRAPEKLSGGERQRVAIARALLSGPSLLALDEPLASLDLERKREILPFLEKLHEVLDIPVVYVSHSPDEVVRLADHLVVLEEGRVLASGPLTDAVLADELPLSFADDFGTVLGGVAHGYDAAYGLLEVAFDGGALRLPHVAVPRGSTLRVQVRARDLSLSRERPEGTSILNLIPVELLPGRRSDGDAHVLLPCRAGKTRFVARITRYSCDRLGFQPGDKAWLQVKSVALIA